VAGASSTNKSALKGVPDYANTVAKDGSLVIAVGQPVEVREKRRVKLMDGQK
jgi:hypothetical protein